VAAVENVMNTPGQGNAMKEQCDKSQAVFRTVIKALSMPGKILKLPFAPEAEEFFDPLVLVLRPLLNRKATFCLTSGSQEFKLEKYLRTVTGSRPSDPCHADFFVAPMGKSSGEILTLKRGSLDCPEQGATVIYGVELLEGDSYAESGVRFSGPGVEGFAEPLIHGLPSKELLYIKEINQEFPLGIDALFVDRQGFLMGLPRSTRIEIRH
jgi:alpha-D-ribose 1-methylphosphonate 5-triphosphate synthase subunit PhnH